MSKKTIIRKFDKLFSRWVRLSHADSNGYCECITCGRSYKWNDIDAGHFVSRRHLALRFDSRNVFPPVNPDNVMFDPPAIVLVIVPFPESAAASAAHCSTKGCDTPPRKIVRM